MLYDSTNTQKYDFVSVKKSKINIIVNHNDKGPDKYKLKIKR